MRLQESLVRSVLWRRVDEVGAEYFALSRSRDGWLLSGTVVVALDERPLHADYEVVADDAWRTREVAVTVAGDGVTRSLTFRVGSKARWRLGPRSAGSEVEHLAGCIDVDLGITPATNLLPIRRLGLAVGDTADVSAAWVGFPGLELARLDQRYTRLAENLYRYESGSGFSTEIEVDDLGLVVSYPPAWERVATFDLPPG